MGMTLTSTYLEGEDDRLAIWNVVDANGVRLANRVSRMQVRARLEHGLLPRNAKVAREGDESWFPIVELVTPGMWWVARAGVVVGPVDGDRVRRGILAEKVPADAMVCRVGERSWQGIKEVDAFRSFVDEVRFDGELTLVAEENSDVRSKPPPPPSRRG
jgi:hypothetical protein